MKFLKQKKLVAVLAVLALALASVGAYAYFTTTGSGTGTATVGTSSAVTVHGVAPTTVYPGGSTSAVNLTVDNPSSGHQYVTTIHLDSITAYPTATDRTNNTNAIVGCGSVDDGSVANAGASDFYMQDVAAAQDFPTGNGQTVNQTGTLVMNNLATSQNACKGAFLKLVLSSN
jgi:hypothetical protein